MYISERSSSTELPKFPLVVPYHIKDELRFCVRSGLLGSRYHDGIRYTRDLFWKMLVKAKGRRNRKGQGEPLLVNVGLTPINKESHRRFGLEATQPQHNSE